MSAQILKKQYCMLKLLESYWTTGSPPFGITMEFLIGISIMVSTTQSYFIHILYFVDPFAKIFLFSSTFLDENSSMVLICLGALPSLWLCTIGYKTINGIFICRHCSEISLPSFVGGGLACSFLPSFFVLFTSFYLSRKILRK